MLEEAPRAPAEALLEPRLHRPDLLHVRAEAVRDRELLALRLQHLVHCAVKGGYRCARPSSRCPSRRARTSCHRSAAKRNPGDTRLVREHALVGALEREHHEALAERLLHDDVEQRQHAVVQPFLAQLRHALERVPGQEQLQHLVEEPRRRHVREQPAPGAVSGRASARRSRGPGSRQTAPPAACGSGPRGSAARRRRSGAACACAGRRPRRDSPRSPARPGRRTAR